MIKKNGFLMLAFVLYLGLYLFLCSIIFYFCSLYFQWTHIARNQVKSLYAYHSVQKKFINDSFECIDIEVDHTKIVFCKDTCNVTWTIKNNSLIRKELFHKNFSSPKNTVYLCTIVDAFQPFLLEYRHNCFLVGFKVIFFHCPFTISTLGQRRKQHEKI